MGTDIEDKVSKLEVKVEHLSEVVKETKNEIKAINTVNNDFNIKLEKVAIALENNVKSTNELTEFYKKQMTKGNMAFSKIGWLIITACISGAIGVLFALLK